MTAVLEDAQELKVDKWGTLNTAASPQRLPEGHSPNNQNVWMDEKPGSVVTANGYTRLGVLPSNLPPTFGIDFFKTSDGSSKFVVSDGQTVWWTTDYVNFTSIITGLSPYFQLRGAVIRDKLWLTNGSDSVRTWDGTTVVLLDGSAGSPTVPKGKYIAYHDERVWLYGIDGDLSSLRFTALADTAGTEIAPTNASAWPADNEIQISEGDADIGTGLWLYRGYLYCSKQFSIWRIVGSDEYDYTRVKTRASTGTRFQESVQIKDNLVHFIGVDGGYVFDGEEARRITDIIDPSSPDEGVFAFRNLQQPLLNTQFWNVSETADFAAGTVPANLSTADDQLTLIPADDSQADFTAGTNTDTSPSDNPGFLQLARVTSGSPGTLISTGKTGTISVDAGGGTIGQSSYITDGNTSNYVGSYLGNAPSQSSFWKVDLGAAQAIGRVIVRNFYVEKEGSLPTFQLFRVEGSNDGTTWTAIASITPPSPIGSFPFASSVFFSNAFFAGSNHTIYHSTETDLTVDFTTASYRYVRFRHTDNGPNCAMVIKELEIYQAGYHATGTFTSKSLDYGTIPATFGILEASIVTNSETYQFYTQSSPDNSTWDALVNVSNGGSIGSTLRRYLRWGVTLNSSTGVSTPVIDKVFVGSTYLSEIHNTGGNIHAWGAFQSSFNKAGQTITLYYRAASTSGGVLAQAWTAILPGASPGAAVTDVYIQIKIEFSTSDPTAQPSVQSFTVNWIIGTGFGVNTLQNVASIVWLNRYWLTAATLGADSNDIIIILGKSTFSSPWHKKPWNILMFCRFNNILIGGSSVDGSLYQLDSGFSQNGDAMDSFYETADLSKSGFQMKGRELLVTADRSGSYDLNVGWSTDGGISYTEKTMDLTRDSGESLSVLKKFNISFMSDTIRFRVRINAADQPFSVDDMTCYYRLSTQRGTLGS